MFSKSNNVIFLVAIFVIISSLLLIKTCNNSSSKIQAKIESNTQDDLLEIKYSSFDSLLNKYILDNKLNILKDSADQKIITYKISNWYQGKYEDFTNKNPNRFKNYEFEDKFKTNVVTQVLDIPDSLILSINVDNLNNEICCKIPADIVFSICKNSIK